MIFPVAYVWGIILVFQNQCNLTNRMSFLIPFKSPYISSMSGKILRYLRMLKIKVAIQVQHASPVKAVARLHLKVTLKSV